MFNYINWIQYLLKQILIKLHYQNKKKKKCLLIWATI